MGLGLITCGGVEDVVSVLTRSPRSGEGFPCPSCRAPGTARGRRGRREKGRLTGGRYRRRERRRSSQRETTTAHMDDMEMG